MMNLTVLSRPLAAGDRALRRPMEHAETPHNLPRPLTPLIGRMEDRRHYLSDVVFGAAIGLAMGEAVIAQRRDNARRLMVEPGRVGLRFGF